MGHPATWRAIPEDDPTDRVVCDMPATEESAEPAQPAASVLLWGKPSLIYDCIAAYGTLTRKQLQTMLGLSRGTIENATRSLITRRLLRHDPNAGTFHLTHLQPVRCKDVYL